MIDEYIFSAIAHLENLVIALRLLRLPKILINKFPLGDSIETR